MVLLINPLIWSKMTKDMLNASAFISLILKCMFITFSEELISFWVA